MSLKRSIVVAAALLVGVIPAGAQNARKLDVSFSNGRVTIVAENVTLQEIFAEWARKGGSRIINAERLPAARLMLTEFKDQPEADVLRTLLREAPGYGAAMRTAAPAGGSTVQTVYILAARTIAPTTSNAVNQPQIQAPPQQATPRILQGSPDDEIPPVRPITGNQPPMTPGGAPAAPSNPNLRVGPGGVVTSTVPGVPIPAPTPNPAAPGTPPAGRGRGGGGGSLR